MSPNQLSSAPDFSELIKGLIVVCRLIRLRDLQKMLCSSMVAWSDLECLYQIKKLKEKVVDSVLK